MLCDVWICARVRYMRGGVVTALSQVGVPTDGRGVRDGRARRGASPRREGRPAARRLGHGLLQPVDDAGGGTYPRRWPGHLAGDAQRHRGGTPMCVRALTATRVRRCLTQCCVRACRAHQTTRINGERSIHAWPACLVCPGCPNSCPFTQQSVAHCQFNVGTAHIHDPRLSVTRIPLHVPLCLFPCLPLTPLYGCGW
jgi:hypothetical protein